MFQTFNQFIRSYQPLEVFLELAVIWVFVYLVFRFLRGTRGAGVIKGFTLMLVALTVVIWLLGQVSDAFGRLNFIYERFFALLAIMLIVVFQPELRQAMIRLGDTPWFRGQRTDAGDVIKSISEAVEFLSKNQFGALIAIERNVRLGGLVEGGQAIDAKVSARLLQSIFWPNSPLHDLGVVIRADRVVAAGVQFPLAEEGTLSANFGARHRAGLGLSNESDSLIVIVSEETGAISIAERGKLDFNIPRENFARLLSERLAAPGTLQDIFPVEEAAVDQTEQPKSKKESEDGKQAA